MGRTRTKQIGADISKESKIEKEAQKKEKKKAYLDKARLYIIANFNNTIISLTDDQGNVLAWSSAGHAGLKNTKKGTPYAGTKAMEVLLEKMKNFKIDELKVFTKGVGPGRETALRVLFNQDYNISHLEDITPIPFGGPKGPRPKRV